MEDLDIYTPLADVDQLSENSAMDVLRFIRSELRLRLLTRLAPLYAKAMHSLDDTLDIMELELRLQEVDAYSDRVADAMQTRQPLPSAHEAEIELEDIHTIANAFAACHARFFFEPVCKYFVHGPVLLQFVASLADRILKPSERITSLRSASWRRPIVNNARLVVRDTTAGRPIPRNRRPEDEYSAFGAFVTSHGRILGFNVLQCRGDPVTRAVGSNQLSLHLLPPKFTHDENRASLEIRLRSDVTSAAVTALDASVPSAMSTLLDIITIGATNLIRQMGCRKGLLLSRVEDLVLPESLGQALRSGMRLEIMGLLEQAHESRKPGFRKVPVLYRLLPEYTAFSRAMFAETSLPYFRLLAPVYASLESSAGALALFPAESHTSSASVGL